MGTTTVVDQTLYTLQEIVDAQFDIQLDITGLDLSAIVKLKHTVNQLVYDIYYFVEYSFDNVTYYSAYSGWADNQFDLTKEFKITNAPPSATTCYVRLKSTYAVGGNDGVCEIYDVTFLVDDLVPNGIDHEAPIIELPIGHAWGAYLLIDQFPVDPLVFEHITSPVVNNGDDVVVVDPTSTNIISGNVSKLNLPFVANVVAVSIGVDPQVVGETVSDELTGDYSLDVYPHVDEVLLYVAPDYGRAFNSSLSMTAGQIMHPTIPNKFVYVAQNDGQVGFDEPTWGEGQIVSNEVTFLPVPLYRPLMNGFVKPTVTPI